MNNAFQRWLTVLLATGLFCAPVLISAAEQRRSNNLTVEQRLERLERILRNQNLADIVLQLQQLQQEVQQLRGEMELQSHTMDALNKRQRDLYLDIDQRLSTLGTGPAPASPEPAEMLSEPEVEMTDSPADADPGNALSVSQPTETIEPPRTVTPPDPKQEAEAYQFAFNLLKQGRYKESIDSFQDFIVKYPGGNYEDNAQYWLGEASYVNRDFDNALAEFDKVLVNYPTSSKVPGALLKSGYIYYEKRDWNKARELFTRLQQQYPGTTEARLAGKRLQRMEKEGH